MSDYQLNRREFLVLAAASLVFVACGKKNVKTIAPQIKQGSFDHTPVLMSATASKYFADRYLKQAGLTTDQVRKQFEAKFPNGADESSLLKQMSNDFAVGKTIQLDGWILSETELQNCVYMQKS